MGLCYAEWDRGICDQKEGHKGPHKMTFIGKETTRPPRPVNWELWSVLSELRSMVLNEVQPHCLRFDTDTMSREELEDHLGCVADASVRIVKRLNQLEKSLYPCGDQWGHALHCTLPKKHEGPHIAHGEGAAVLRQWES